MRTMNNYNIPNGPSLLEAFRKSFKMVKAPIDVISKNIEKYGDAYGIKSVFANNIIVTRNPDFIDYVLKKNHKNYEKSNLVSHRLGRFLGNGLLTSNGSYWLRQRRLIQPGFHKQKIEALFKVMQETIDEFLIAFPTGEQIDVYPLTNKLAFNVVINTLFKIPMSESDIQELAKIISEVQSYIVREIRQPYKYPYFFLSGIIKGKLKQRQRARDIILNMITQRRNSGEKMDDLLDMLLEARYEDDGKPMEDDQIIDEIMILIVAGHETSANALAWALYLLSAHTEVLHDVRESTLNNSLSEIIYHKKIAAVLKETLRLYPPAWILDRVAIEDDKFGDYFFPGGTIIVLYIYGLHHDSRFWPDAAQFNPYRFLEENVEKVVMDSFYPFGAGPRFCIGSGFAMGEMALFLNSFIHRFNFFPTHRPEMIPLVTLRPQKVLLKIERRK